ncbi:MAG: 5-(carboxyamino)imidazole ribonucleotide mutase [Gammaproteobacteria bacterium]
MAVQVGIIMGSQSDWEIMQNASTRLDDFGIDNECRVISAHRAPHALADYCNTAAERGIKVIIAGAGLAAALPGTVAALTPLPVLGVPMESRALGGLDALLSIVQMPAGIPVGTLAIGKAGAINAAMLATAILALSDDDLRAKLDDFRAAQTQKILDMPPLKG